jgi:hypothetical protein
MGDIGHIKLSGMHDIALTSLECCKFFRKDRGQKSKATLD